MAGRIEFWIALCLGSMAMLAVPHPASSQAPMPRSALALLSSDRRLVASFDWAKAQALRYVKDGDPVGPWYEAALPGRRAFCMRDVSHQAAGAQALGLAGYTHNMLRRFAENISPSRDWCSYWEIDYQNRPASVDYVNDSEFWYNLPANFDVIDACYRMYLWTGDRSYLEDPVFLNFYRRSVLDYVPHWHLDAAHIMERETIATNQHYFHGDPSYEENRFDLALGIDLLATQFAGYRSYAAIAAIRGEPDAARLHLRLAAEVKAMINTRWWNPTEGDFYAYLDNGHRFYGRAGADLLYRDAADDGSKARSALHAMLEAMRDEPDSAVESKSHYAEILYRYGEPAAAYAQILDLSRPGRARQEYPEVSYSVIGAVVNGLMGIEVEPSAPLEVLAAGEPFKCVVRTLPQLPATAAWAELRRLPVGRGEIDVRHTAQSKTVLTNRSKTALEWKAAFLGTFTSLEVDGRPHAAQTGGELLGRAITWVIVRVPAGATMSVATSK